MPVLVVQVEKQSYEFIMSVIIGGMERLRGKKNIVRNERPNRLNSSSNNKENLHHIYSWGCMNCYDRPAHMNQNKTAVHTAERDWTYHALILTPILTRSTKSSGNS